MQVFFPLVGLFSFYPDKSECHPASLPTTRDSKDGGEERARGGGGERMTESERSREEIER